MAKILITTHGHAGDGLINSLSMFSEKIVDVTCITLDGNNHNDLIEDIKKYIIKNSKEEILVLTDLLGGSPFQICLKIKYELNVELEVITGVNFPMLLEVYLNKNELLPELSQRAVNCGRQGINIAKAQETINEDDE